MARKEGVWLRSPGKNGCQKPYPGAYAPWPPPAHRGFTSGPKGIRQPKCPAKCVLAGRVARSHGLKPVAGTARPHPSPAQGGADWNSPISTGGDEGALRGAGLGHERAVPAPRRPPGAAIAGTSVLLLVAGVVFFRDLGCRIPLGPEVNPRWAGGRARSVSGRGGDGVPLSRFDGRPHRGLTQCRKSFKPKPRTRDKSFVSTAQNG
jgi:hypothetical protein